MNELTWPEVTILIVVVVCVTVWIGTLVTGRWPWDRGGKG